MPLLAKDYIGSRFGRLTVSKELERRNGKRYVECICDCGTVKEIQLNHLKTGHVFSCGCVRSEYMSKKIKLSEFVVITLNGFGSFETYLEAERFIMQNPNRPYIFALTSKNAMRFEFFHSNHQNKQILASDWYVMPKDFEVEQYEQWAATLKESAKKILPHAEFVHPFPEFDATSHKWRLTQQIHRGDSVKLLGDFDRLNDAITAGNEALKTYSEYNLLIVSLDGLNHRVICENGIWINSRTGSYEDVLTWLNAEKKKR